MASAFLRDTGAFTAALATAALEGLAARQRAEWAEEQRFRAEEKAQLDTSLTYFFKKEQAGTYCTQDGSSRPVLVLADDVGAHVFRHEVAAFLAPVWPKRADALSSCGEAAARCDCGDCGTPHVLPYRCGARSCPTCAHTAAAVVCEKAAIRAERALLELQMAELWEGQGKPRKKTWKMVTLTTRAKKTAAERYVPAELRRMAKEVRRALGRWWRLTRWGRRVRDLSKKGKTTKRARRDTLYIAGIEIAPGGMVHAHLAIYGEYIPTQELRALWMQECDVGGFVNIRAMKAAGPDDFRKALREVLKYVSKGDKEPGRRAERAALIEAALRGIRRIEVGGAMRMVPKVTAKDVATNARVCETCGGGASWRWRGVRAPAYVRENGGFGLARIVDREDVRRRERHNDDAAAAVIDELHRERAPGGRFFGGEPPPWMDDTDEWETTLEGHAPVPRELRPFPLSP